VISPVGCFILWEEVNTVIFNFIYENILLIGEIFENFWGGTWVVLIDVRLERLVIKGTVDYKDIEALGTTLS
jgi:hypothetical protein